MNRCTVPALTSRTRRMKRETVDDSCLHISGELTSNNKEMWERHTNSDPRYEGWVRVKYEDQSKIIKHIDWKNRAIEMTKDSIRPTDINNIELVPSSLVRRKIVKEGDGRNVDDGIETRLADLGYL